MILLNCQIRERKRDRERREEGGGGGEEVGEEEGEKVREGQRERRREGGSQGHMILCLLRRTFQFPGEMQFFLAESVQGNSFHVHKQGLL